MAATNNTENKNSIQLIVFDSNQKIDFCCTCKITVNAITKKLIVVDQTQGSRKIEASFDHSFFIQKNILCVLNPKSNNIEFALIFKNETIAKKVFDVINKTKSANDFETIEKENNDEIFDNKFLFLLFDSISSSKTETFSISMVHNFINSSINRKKERYIKILKEKNIYEIIYPVNTSTIARERKRKVDSSNLEIDNSKKIKQEDIKTENMQINEKENNSDGENEFDKSIYKEEYIKTEMDEDYFEDSNSNELESNDSDFEISDEDEESLKSDLEKEDSKNEFQAIGNQSMILRPSDFVFCSNNYGIPKTNLIIFDKNDRNFCYKYGKHQKEFICHPCYRKKKICKAKIIKDKGEECILLKNFNHVCELRPYEPEKEKQIIRSPDFELISNKYGVPKSVIIIFDPANRNLCYRYHLHGKQFFCSRCYKPGKKRTAIKLCHDEKNDESYVVAKENDHICHLQPYIPDIKNHRIIEKPDFEWQCSRQGKPKTKLIVFANSSKSLCYSYGKQNDYWYCHRCARDGVYVSIKIIKNIKGEECIEIVNENHACGPVAYMPEEKYRIIKAANFELRPNKYGVADEILILYASEEKKLCYAFRFCYSVYVCWACSTMKHHLSGKVIKNENGEMYFKVKDIEHVCTPQEYKPYINPNEIEKDIIKSPNFELHANKIGVPNTRLIIFAGNDRSLFYNFSFKKNSKAFTCSGCFKNHILTKAKVIKNDEDGTQYVEIKSNSHICKPEIYIPPIAIDISIIKSPDFLLIPNDKGIPNAILIIYKDSKKTSYYKFNSVKKHFVCISCKNLKENTSAKLHKDEKGEEFIQVTSKHACQPRKGKPK